MTKTNLLNTRTVNFLELIGNGRIYRVPPYQRDYSWEAEQWEDLWNDLIALRDSTDDRHYMGALVVEGINDREFRIIDGQQRLATLSILALAVIARLEDLAARGVDGEANRQRADGLRARFIGEKDPASLIESSKLFLNETDDPFYQDYLVQLRPPLNPRGQPKSNRLLWECYNWFAKQIADNPTLQNQGVALAELLSETLARQLLFILITVEDELNAYTVFETLNARGLELSSTDLLKNYLFSRVKVTADLSALQRRWRRLVATVRQEKFPEFLRYHLLCTYPQVRQQRLFKLIRDQVKNSADVFNLLAALETRAELFAALFDVEHEYWIDNLAARPFIRELNLFRVRQMTPLLFAAWGKFSPENFTRLLRMVSVISFRYSVISGLNPNELESVYHFAARAVLAGQAQTPAALFEYLRPIYVDDGKFIQDFAGKELQTAGQRRRLVKYILCKIESASTNRVVDYEADPATVEHILPENPDSAWDASFPRERQEAMTYRLGNLTLLEANRNRAVGNLPYAEKLDAYGSSIYALSREVAEQFPLEWTPVTVQARQRTLAQRAAQIWRVDY
jgi:hypothetical protein